jgi:transcriptional regulator PpsR
MKAFDAPTATLGDVNATKAGTLIATSSDIALILDAEGYIRDLACGSEQMASEGYEQWLGQRWSDTVTVESRAKVEALLRDASKGEAARWRHVNHPSPRGPDLPLMYAAVSVGADEPTSAAVGRSVVFGRDMRATAALQQRLVDAQQAMERDYWRLRDAETRHRLLFELASEAVLVVDMTTLKVTEVNPAATEMFAEGGRKLVGASFPFGFGEAGSAAVQSLLAAMRAGGRTGEVLAELADGRGEVKVSGSMFRQENNSMFLMRLTRVVPTAATAAKEPNLAAMQQLLVQGVPDCLLLTDGEGKIISANAAFVELTQLANEEQVKGESLSRWLGRTGIDLSVLVSNLRQRGSVRLFATTLRGEHGASTDVEISAVMLSLGGEPFLGFSIRDIGRRLGSESRLTRDLPKSVGQLTELVGRVPMKDIVGETSDLIEQLCIEAALELTHDNRAAAAEMLGLSRQSLYVKMRRFGLGDLVPETEK